MQRVPYQQRPLRNEYRLTEKGRSLMPILLALTAWGDQYLAGEQGPPRIAHHERCGGQPEIHVVCAQCRQTLVPDEVEL